MSINQKSSARTSKTCDDYLVIGHRAKNCQCLLCYKMARMLEDPSVCKESSYDMVKQVVSIQLLTVLRETLNRKKN